jgi:hypothetical protein
MESPLVELHGTTSSYTHTHTILTQHRSLWAARAMETWGSTLIPGDSFIRPQATGRRR